MPRDRYEDETTTDPVKLLERYRELCEMVGYLKANGASIHSEIRQDLRDVEAEIQSRLWLASRGGSAVSPGPAAARAPRPSTGGGGRSPLPHEEGEAMPRPSPMSQHPAPGTQHPAPTEVAEVYSDGACIGNPGPGGFGTIVRVPGRPERVITGSKARTTNNEMELTGVIEGLRAAQESGAAEIAVFSDSEYLVKGMNQWIKGWLRNGWKTRTGHPVKNRELWEELHRLAHGREMTWSWVPGHAGHPENERCNTLAVEAARHAADRR